MTAPLRILALAPTGFFADYGCHVRIRGQLAALVARGHTVRLVTYPSGRDVAPLPTIRPRLWPRSTSMPVGSSRRKLLLDALLAPTALDAALRFPGGPPQIIHAYLHEGALLGTVLARLLRWIHRTSKAPVVFDFQGSLVSEMLDHGFLSERARLLHAWQSLETWIDRQPQAILASSQHAANLLVETYGVPPQRVHPLADSVDPRVFRPRADLPPDDLASLRRQYQLPADRPIIIYLGLLAPYQGTDVLLHALARLEHVDPRPFGVIMGFPNVERYREMANGLDLAGHTVFTGAVPFEAAPLHVALGDVAVAPKLSATEGSGKLLTYMAAGLPVVAFDTPVHREYLGELGIYAAPGDADQLAGALNAALHHPQRPQLGTALRQLTIEDFTWDHAAARIETIYREC